MRAIWVCLLVSVEVVAGSESGRKAALKRSQASDLVNEVLAGGANPNTIVNRIKHLSEEAFAARELGSLLINELDLEKRRVMVQVLAGLAHPQGEGGLLIGLKEEDPSMRMHSAQGLGRIRSKTSGPHLAAALVDRTLGVRRDAAHALGSLGDPKYAAPLAKAVKAEDDPETRAVMLLAIGKVGDKKQVPLLESFLAHSSESARFGAAAGLCALGAPAGGRFAQGLLASKDPHQRRQGLKLFEGSRAKQAAAIVEPLLKDPDRSLQAAAARILYQGGDPSKLEWLVLASFQALGDERLPYEKELEMLRLTDDQRRAILDKASRR